MALVRFKLVKYVRVLRLMDGGGPRIGGGWNPVSEFKRAGELARGEGVRTICALLRSHFANSTISFSSSSLHFGSEK